MWIRPGTLHCGGLNKQRWLVNTRCFNAYVRVLVLVPTYAIFYVDTTW